MNQAQKATIEKLSRECGKTLEVGPIMGWVHRCRRGDLQAMSDTAIRVAIAANGNVTDIDLGSFLQSSPPHGNETPENLFRVAVMALRYPGRTFGDICRTAGGSKAKFDVGWMPAPVGLEKPGSSRTTAVTTGTGVATAVRRAWQPEPSARTTSAPYRFVLQFSPSEIPALVARRMTNVEQDRAFEAGNAIRRGNYGRQHLKVIVDWKIEARYLARVLSYLDQNSDADIAAALRVAATRADEHSAIEALECLHGIGVPVASAILTTIHPERYTIIDVNALKSLGVSDGPTDSVEYYLAYLRRCRELAGQLNISLRTLDHALWQWGHEH